MKKLITDIVERTELRFLMACDYRLDIMGASQFFDYVYREQEPLGMADLIDAFGDSVSIKDRPVFYKHRRLINVVLTNIVVGKDVNLEETFPVHFMVRARFWEGMAGVDISDTYNMPYRAIQRINPLQERVKYIVERYGPDIDWQMFQYLLPGRPVSFQIESFVLFQYLTKVGSEADLVQLCLDRELLESSS